MARVDYDQMAASYDHGRALSPEGLEGWRAALAAWLPPPDGLPVLDLGAGTGLFATAIATCRVRVPGAPAGAAGERAEPAGGAGAGTASQRTGPPQVSDVTSGQIN